MAAEREAVVAERVTEAVDVGVETGTQSRIENERAAFSFLIVCEEYWNLRYIFSSLGKSRACK